MEIFDFAMNMEHDAEAYYRELAVQMSNAGFKKIFNWLADEEAKHYSVLLKMKEGHEGHVSSVDLLANVKPIFEKIKAEWAFDFTASQVALYKNAQGIEQKSRVFYLEKSEQADNQLHKELFKKLAAEELKHFEVLENIIEFVLRPEQWAENAEFYHSEDY